MLFISLQNAGIRVRGGPFANLRFGALCFPFCKYLDNLGPVVEKLVIAVFKDVLFHRLFLLPIYLRSKISIKPLTKGAFHCKMCHVGQEFTVWDFVALAVHCGFLAGALIERIFTRFELSFTYFLMVIIRVAILFTLDYYHFRKEMAELEQRANSRA